MSTTENRPTVLVTGATGAIGSRLTGLLLARRERVRALVRDPRRARIHLGADVELAVGDFSNATSLRAALDSVEAVYLACANVPGQVEYECALIDEAVQAGVQRIVKLSARGADLESPVAYWRWHAQIEQHLRASEIAFVSLQPSFAMTNLLAAADPVSSSRVIFAPAAAAAIAMIHPADVAAVAAVTLKPGHEGSTHVLTGPQAIDYAGVAAELTAATGQQITYVDVPPRAALAAMIDSGLPRFVAEQLLALFDALRRGDQEQTTATVDSVTGRPPRPFAVFASEHAALFTGEAVA